MHNVLLATSPAPDRAEAMMLYGRFVGSWTGRVVVHAPERRESSAEVHFAWALEGRAVQDVWIAPARVDGPARMYGTTLRVYDPEKRHWRITWIDPVKQVESHMIGRASGADIVQEYLEAGVRTQWCFTEITDDSFHWIARQTPIGAEDWMLLGEFFLRRS